MKNFVESILVLQKGERITLKMVEDKAEKKVSKNYISIKNIKQLEEIEKELDNCKYFSFDTETTSLIAHEAELVGFSFALNRFLFCLF